ncbi:hypothetical protein QTO34_020210 [Cnephaeus nilssonii]|uniref:Uncharacterized protein n=1 Tax=Cnephaeus nilssonii TaxID=3371016 RepID=A0AA40LPU5_CNENI|nr:hypothetical protein QTO34_020210 [Eptesicus nilssonii]
MYTCSPGPTARCPPAPPAPPPPPAGSLTQPLSAVSGRQLQAEDPDADTEEDRSVTEGPGEEIIRPRPQGSSPVYECVTEGAGFGLRVRPLDGDPGLGEGSRGPVAASPPASP